MSDVEKSNPKFGIKDEKIRQHLYLDLSIDALIEKMGTLQLTDICENREMPFFAQVRGYLGAKDPEGGAWLVKEVTEEEAKEHKAQEIAYYIDFMLGTLAAPTILSVQNGVFYRATKTIKSAMQIGSYNYLEEPFKKILANDLINRWLFFDEDRNPNNYLVLHDIDSKKYVIVIDYNKADLLIRGMKISGNNQKFGWQRKEQTRFLTLLKPENFSNMCIDDFEDRLSALMNIEPEKIMEIGRKAYSFFTESEQKETVELITANVLERRTYINDYFRKWFKPRDIEQQKQEDQRYAGLGQSFLDYYKKKE